MTKHFISNTNKTRFTIEEISDTEISETLILRLEDIKRVSYLVREDYATDDEMLITMTD